MRNLITGGAGFLGSHLTDRLMQAGEEVICVFVPTTPNPTSGLILMVPKADVIELDMEVEDALKMVVSLGVVVPQWSGDNTPAPLGKARP